MSDTPCCVTYCWAAAAEWPALEVVAVAAAVAVPALAAGVLAVTAVVALAPGLGALCSAVVAEAGLLVAVR